MLNDYQKSICKKAIERYGKHKQLSKVSEELAELIAAISKLLAEGGRVDPIIGEHADVQIMLYQLQLLLGYDDNSLDNSIRHKINRLEKRFLE